MQKKHSPAALAAAFRRQAGYCAELGSPLWAEAMGKVAEISKPAGTWPNSLRTGRAISSVASCRSGFLAVCISWR